MSKGIFFSFFACSLRLCFALAWMYLDILHLKQILIRFVLDLN